jgi:hypothetical protein
MTSIAREPGPLAADASKRTNGPPDAPRMLAGVGAHMLSIALLTALVLGGAIRAWHTWSVDFPLNDGGLFYVMARDLQQAHYHLPAYTSYNGAHIPFAYSPFTFYLAAALSDLLGRGSASLLLAIRLLPFLASTACIAAFYPFARAMVTSRAATAASLIAFAIVPRGFVWLLMGGGLTRSFGYLFALLALYWIWLLYTRRSLRYVPLAALFSALTALSHLGTAPFVAFSAVLFFLFRGRHREGVMGSGLVGLGALALTSPWWGTVIATHGVGPFLAARATSGSPGWGTLLVLGRLALGTTGEGMFPLIWALALLGVLWCVRERRALLPTWWAVILMLDPRAGTTYAAAPVAMLAGIGAVRVLWPLVMLRGGAAPPARRPVVLAVFALLLAGSILSAASDDPTYAGETRVLQALTPADRAAMRWVAVHTDTLARVLVLSNVPWQIDRVSEWFPVLTERVSVATVQGTEWIPRGAFGASIRRQWRLSACANGTTACLDSLRRDPALRFTHVYAPSGPTDRCCRALVAAMHRDPRFEMVYDGRGATIFARR